MNHSATTYNPERQNVLYTFVHGAAKLETTLVYFSLIENCIVSPYTQVRLQTVQSRDMNINVLSSYADFFRVAH